MIQTEFRPELLAAAEEIDAHARATGRRTADLALQWVLANPIVTSVLIGPKSMTQLDGYLTALSSQFFDEDEARIEAVAPTGCVIGRYADPRYPFRGRPIRNQ
jgi:aryl-alcohol dehydrogenase-like predicted oxidoreductase